MNELEIKGERLKEKSRVRKILKEKGRVKERFRQKEMWYKD